VVSPSHYITLTAVHLWQNGTGWRAVNDRQGRTEAGASGDDLGGALFVSLPARYRPTGCALGAAAPLTGGLGAFWPPTSSTGYIPVTTISAYTKVECHSLLWYTELMIIRQIGIYENNL